MRYAALLISLLFLAVVVPLFEGTGFDTAVTDLVSIAILVSGVWAASHRARDVAILAMLAILMTTRWLPFSGQRGIALLSGIAGALFFVYVAGIILADLMAARRVTIDTIGGAACGYLMIGLAFGSLYFVIELLHPGAFNLAESARSSFRAMNAGYLHLAYYSIVTLTTVGYGDINAKIPIAENLSAIEAMIGQFYIAVLVARLVSIQILQRGE